ncbi:unnamed protein product [Prorocentrum cordatum]|uniref:Uncharacterized protein n=1 Tax=Prorocentrum cordatum TaxID=2364126 RepID=A0ABN9UNF5_9DINO|nr:unnamed protein product [Polarella glacialis]
MGRRLLESHDRRGKKQSTGKRRRRREEQDGRKRIARTRRTWRAERGRGVRAGTCTNVHARGDRTRASGQRSMRAGTGTEEAATRHRHRDKRGGPRRSLSGKGYKLEQGPTVPAFL